MSVNLSRLKAYAPQARKDFRKAVTERAARIGITASGIVEAQHQGDVVIVGGTAYDKTFGKQRDVLVFKVKTEGFDHAIEEIAYTWFNRLVALRFMELHGYLEHGFQIVGPGKTEGVLPEALVNAELLNLPRLSPERVREMKIAGDYEEQLYRAILIAQCNALSGTMSFMFEKIGDATELLLPDNLLATDGLVRKLVWNSDATSWKDVEVIGWLYQFYISEKKDDVFKALKKNVKIDASSIPAATQLFTPHWIVRYLVENSLGRLWILNNPSSKLAEKMGYYIAPEEPETDFLTIISPEEIRVCDPACGSGHMLTYAFDLLYAMYEEAGYRSRDIPSCILEKNLQGVEIDDRAGALAAFSLAMKARAQDGRFFTRPVKPKICILENVAFTAVEKRDVSAVVGNDLFSDELWATLGQFEQAKNVGSLIVPKLRVSAEMLKVVESRDFSTDLLLKEVKKRVLAVLRMAEALSPKYQVVVANPPYMGSAGMNAALKSWIEKHFKAAKLDAMTCFMDRASKLVQPKGSWGMINLPSWLFLGSYSHLRTEFLTTNRISSFLHLGRGVFGPDFGSVAFVANRIQEPLQHRGRYFKLFEKHSLVRTPEEIERKFLERECETYLADQKNFLKIPGAPIAYWHSVAVYQAFEGRHVSQVARPMIGIQSGDNDRFYRQWQEVCRSNISTTLISMSDTTNERVWAPLQRGGDARKWYGNNSYVVNLSNSAHDIKSAENSSLRNSSEYFRECITWNRLSNGRFYVRYVDGGFAFDDVSPFLTTTQEVTTEDILACLGSSACQFFVRSFSTGYKTEVGHVAPLPLPGEAVGSRDWNLEIRSVVQIARTDWDAYEVSWNFTTLPLLSPHHRGKTLEDSYATLRTYWQSMTDEMQRLEQENNRIFITAYGLQDELTPVVPIDEITLTCNPNYRYGEKGSLKEREELLKRDTMREFISYSIGCLMGRYSLAVPGLIYANAGNIGFDATRYGDFPVDDDGIVPVTDAEWFPDDAVACFIEFLRQTFGEERLSENLDFVADALDSGRKASAADAIRKYISRSFFKDHLRTYKSRPIYWLFSSGKERAFECLVYLHRYNESTLGRMRAEYVIPLQTKMQNRIRTIESEIGRGDLSSAQTKARTKELASLEAKKTELDRFEANLRHVAEERIALDLDDGVKVNYAKFGGLLAEKDLVCGKDDD